MGVFRSRGDVTAIGLSDSAALAEFLGQRQGGIFGIRKDSCKNM